MSEVDLHPDVVSAIQDLSATKLGRRYGRMARRRYGVPGWKLAGKTVAGEFGGRSTESGRGVVSSAGARGPAQFIPSTREAYIRQYGVDPWKNDRQAIKGLMLHQLNTGVEGYNPGMPTYKDYILGQRLNAADRRALRAGAQGSGNQPRSAARGTGAILELEGPTRTRVSSGTTVIPGVSFEAERTAARRQLLLGGELNLGRLLEYKSTVNSMQDVPERVVRGPIQVDRQQGAPVRLRTRGQQRQPSRGAGAGRRDPAPNTKGGIYEVFYDPINTYWDSGSLHKGAIGDHGDHVHVSADVDYVVKLGRLAQSMGLHVGEQGRFGGTPTGGHTEGSFHYRDMAIDVSGPPDRMRKFARIVLNAARQGRGR